MWGKDSIKHKNVLTFYLPPPAKHNNIKWENVAIRKNMTKDSKRKKIFFHLINEYPRQMAIY